MGQKQKSPADPITEPKKRRRVGFSVIDAGVEANERIKIYLVSSKEEVGVLDSFCINPVDLNSYFEEDGKIYGHQGLKITIWVNIVSFSAYADIAFESTSDGGKGITDLKSSLQNIFAETLVENKDDFLKTFSTENDFIRYIYFDHIGWLKRSRPRLELPLFTGIDPFGWLFQAEQYFEYYHMSDWEKVTAAINALEGMAVRWFQWLDSRIYIRSWEMFKMYFLKNLPEDWNYDYEERRARQHQEWWNFDDDWRNSDKSYLVSGPDFLRVPTIPTKFPTTLAGIPAAPAEFSAAPVEFPADSKEFPAGPEEISAGPEEISAGPAEFPASPPEIPAPPAEVPVPPAEIPTPPTEIPMPPAKLPAPTAEIPAPPAEIPAPPAEFPAPPAEILVPPAEIPAIPAEISVVPVEFSAVRDNVADHRKFPAARGKFPALYSSAVSSGEVLQLKASNGHIRHCNGHLEAAGSDLEVVRMGVDNVATGHLYSRLVPLVLLLVDGSNPIDVTDPRWELYLLIQKKTDKQGDIQHRLLGFTAIYRFFHYPDSTRMRLSQILILPPYQRKGYGSYLVEVLSNVASAENVHDFTVEEPLDSFQHVRTCVDIQRLLAFEPVQDAVMSTVLQLKQGKLSKKIHAPQFVPPASVVEEVRKTLKINRKQFFQCWEILIYLGVDHVDKCMEDYNAIISNRVRADIFGKDSGSAGKRVIDVPTTYDTETSFVMFRSQDWEPSSVQMEDGNQTNIEEQLQKLVNERIKEIKSIAQKVSPCHV